MKDQGLMTVFASYLRERKVRKGRIFEWAHLFRAGNLAIAKIVTFGI